MRRRTGLGLKVLGLLAVLAMVAAACTSTSSSTTTAAPSTTASTTTTTTKAPTGTTTTTTAPKPQGFTYKIGMTSDVQSTNFWAYIANGSVYDAYVVGPTKPSLFGIAYPGIVVAPVVADGLPAEPVQEGDTWTVTQKLRTDYTWSDGTPVTAKDVAFTFEAVSKAGMGGDWISGYPYTEASKPRLLNVEAIDDQTVKFTFDSEPGAAVWPHNVGVAAIMPESVWRPVLEDALKSDDPAGALQGADPLEVGDLSAGPVMLKSREEGAFIENVVNDNYADAGMEHKFYSDGTYEQNGTQYYGSGGGDVVVDYKEGPYLQNEAFSIYGDQAAAMLALTNGDIDIWMNPLGVSPGLRQQGLDAENLAVAVNPTNGFRYLAFNFRKAPMKFKAFRQALAYLVDKEFLTKNVLQGVAFPLYVLVPEGNTAWYNKDEAEKIASKYVGLDEQTRLNKAYQTLEDGGFTWKTPPEKDADGNITKPGSGLIDPDGRKVPPLEVMAPPASYDPLRATASLWIEKWLKDMGVQATANPTDFNTIIAKVWPGVGNPPTFDMYILGWSLGNPAWPTFHEAFFHSRNFAEVNDGANAAGYSDPEFDAMADEMFATRDQQKAYDLIWKMEDKIAEDLPYIVLFDTPITEFYNKDLQYPFTKTLSGIQALSGMPESVQKK